MWYPAAIRKNNNGSRPRICLIRHGRYPNDPRSRKQMEALAEAGYAVDVLCLKGAGQAFRETMGPIRIYRLPIKRRRASMWRYFYEYGLSLLMFGFLVTIFHIRRRYRCIHVATMPDFLVFTAIIPKWLGAKVVLDLHEPTPELWQTKYGDRLRTLLHMQTWIEQAAIEYADATVTVTDELRDRIIERGSRPDKIFVVSNVCDDRIFSGSGQPAPSSGQGFHLITHGLIDERYGHEEMVRAVAGLRDELPNLHLEVLGLGEYQSRLIDLVRALNCEDLVAFPGFVPHDDLIRRLKAADAGVIAMRSSPYSELIDTNKMYEYMALHKPIIISRLQPVARKFDESCVKLFTPGDDEDLARCIRDLFHDPERGRKLADNAYRRYEQLRWEYEKKKYVRIVNDLATHGILTERPGERTEPRMGSLSKENISSSFDSDVLDEDLEPVGQTTAK